MVFVVRQVQAAAFCLECSEAIFTSSSNVLGSSMATWLSILRFSRIPACWRPCMKTLYRVPRIRQAAVIRVIQRRRKVRFLFLRRPLTTHRYYDLPDGGNIFTEAHISAIHDFEQRLHSSALYQSVCAY